MYPFIYLYCYTSKKKLARDKIWTYNLNIFRVPLYQLSFSGLFYTVSLILDTILLEGESLPLNYDRLYLKVNSYIYTNSYSPLIPYNDSIEKKRLLSTKYINLHYISKYILETPGFEPRIMTCKVTVLPN